MFGFLSKYFIIFVTAGVDSELEVIIVVSSNIDS